MGKRGSGTASLLGALLVLVGLMASGCANDSVADRVVDAKRSASAWVKVTGDGFTAQFPSEPTERSQDTPGPGGQAITTTVYAVGADHDAIALSATRYPADMPFSLDEAVQGSATSIGMTLAGSEPSQLGGVPARTFRLTGKVQGHEATAFGTVAYKGGVMVMVQYIVAGTAQNPPELYQRLVKRVSFT